MSHTFVCYSRKDQDFVVKFVAGLRARGAILWLDQEDIVPGSDWDLSIDQALAESSRLVIVLSPDAVESREVRAELRVALDTAKTIVPVFYRACEIPRQLRLLQYVDIRARAADDPIALDMVLNALGVASPPAAVTTPLLASPRVVVAPPPSMVTRVELPSPSRQDHPTDPHPTHRIPSPTGLTRDDVRALSELQSRDASRRRNVGAIQTPLTQIIRLLHAPHRELVCILDHRGLRRVVETARPVANITSQSPAEAGRHPSA